MINQPADDVPDSSSDPFGPPEKPVEVSCLHCGQTYRSDLIVWKDGFWKCPTLGCDGAGFGFDIFPVDPDWVDPTGRLRVVEDEYEDEELDDDVN